MSDDIPNPSELGNSADPAKENPPLPELVICYGCGQIIEKKEYAKICKGCELTFHPFCGFPTSESEICANCMYREHERQYKSHVDERSRISRMGCVYVISMSIFLLFSVYFGLDYVIGNTSTALPFFIMMLFTLISLIMVLRVESIWK